MSIITRSFVAAGCCFLLLSACHTSQLPDTQPPSISTSYDQTSFSTIEPTFSESAIWETTFKPSLPEPTSQESVTQTFYEQESTSQAPTAPESAPTEPTTLETSSQTISTVEPSTAAPPAPLVSKPEPQAPPTSAPEKPAPPASEPETTTSPVSEPETTAPPAISIPSDRQRSLQAFHLQNQLLSEQHVTPLQWSEGLYQIAVRRLAEIAVDYSHNGCPDWVAENILRGTNQADIALQVWSESPGHRRNMLAGWTYGAVANQGYYWVAIYAMVENP